MFRSALGSGLLAALSSGPATFEIDGGDPVERTGWSVIIAGQSEEVTDPAEIERLEAFELEPWAPGLEDALGEDPSDFGFRSSDRSPI